MVSLLVLVAAALLLLGGLASAQEVAGPPGAGSPFVSRPDAHRVALDLYAFGQRDGGGNPLLAEGFATQAIAVEARLPVGGRRVVEASVVFSLIQNDSLMRLPSTIANPRVTSASADFVTLDSSLRLELSSADGRWVVTPGLFYHHQWAYIAGGVDLDVRRFLMDGDAVLRAAYGGRVAQLFQDHWDRKASHPDYRVTHNLVLAWTQTLSPSAIAGLGLQVTRQDGLLHSTLQYVGLRDAGGAPVLLVDEALPRTRNRVQLNLRGRYSPQVGRSLGLDLSGYRDDWGIQEGAVEPSFETPLLAGIRARLWYRVAVQRGSRYFVAAPTAALRYMTQNASLASFVLQSPGLLLLVPLGSGSPVSWVGRATALGFTRSDGIRAAGGSLGVAAEW